MAGVGDTDRDTKLRLDRGVGGGGGGWGVEWSEMGRSDMALKEATCANHKVQPRMLQVIGANVVDVNNGSVSSV